MKEMNQAYTEIRDQFKEWAKDSTSLLEGKSELLEQYVKPDDPILYKSLSKPMK